MTTRRSLLKNAAIGGGIAGLGLIGWQIGGQTEWLSPGDAKRRGVPLHTLTDKEAVTLEALGEVLLPGSGMAGIAQFVDYHIGLPAPESLLTVRYLDVPPPYAEFYKGGLAALNELAGGRFADLVPAEAIELVTTISRNVPPGWHGPPAPMFYFAVRSDAVDVVYGTSEGIASLGVPTMEHLLPETKW